MDKHEESLKDLNESLKINPNCVEALNNRGLTYQSMGRYEESLADLNRLLEINPNFIEGLVNRGVIYQSMGRYDESLADLKKSLEINPNSAEVLSNRGLTYYKMKRYKESLEDLSKALEINPNFVEALNNRGLTYQGMGRYEESLVDLNKSLEINPNSVVVLNSRGFTYQSMGRYEESLVDFNKSLEIDPNYEPALVNRGLVYQERGRYEESYVDLNESLIKSHRTNVQNNKEATTLRFGTCANCKQYNSGIDFCNLCDDYINKVWTSGDKKIDEFIKLEQMNTPYYHKVIEWIPFDRLENIEKIGKGGFSTIYSATWIDGKRAYSWDKTKGKLIKTREKFCKVALKSLTGTQNISLNFLNEFKALYECQLEKLSVEKYGIEIYGITYDTNRKEYMMVFEHADKGDLRHYLSENFASLTWKQKLKLLYSISDNLDYIHQKRYVHKDFHSGNILIVSTGSFDLNALLYSTYIVNNKAIMITQDNGEKLNIEPKISDLGLSSKIDEINVENGTYGVVQYVADEILSGEPYTKASDIYSLGVIMSEVSTGKPPFENLSCSSVKLRKVLDKLRPEFAKGTPECFIELANQCMDNDPEKRPKAKEVYEKLREWRIILDKGTNELNNEELKIKNAFLKADEIIFSQSETLQRHTDAKYTFQFEIDEIISSRPETPKRDPDAIYTAQLIIIGNA
ncbi:hypothetical protein C2G38_2014583 [Gigaspora rosea]|uniref:Protein kinase domain-containing protein n=1 Tax=Gigaspora rosea TaxID=44941 RepID=A0A397VLK7_9GLOM|nr:hypothetical protein C2G38_2014583 [Gigaspora rosea]